MGPEFYHDIDDGTTELTESDLSREVCLKLSETSTMWLLDRPSICVMSASDEALEIARQKSRYEEVTDYKTPYFMLTFAHEQPFTVIL